MSKCDTCGGLLKAPLEITHCYSCVEDIITDMWEAYE